MYIIITQKIFLAFYRKDHLQKHLQTHNKHFLEVNINPVSDQELDIKQEMDECEELNPIITSVTGNADLDSSTEVRFVYF